MIRAVIFDIDNTMYNFDRAHAAAMEALFRYGNQALSLEPGSMKEGLSAAQKLILDRLGTNSSAIHNRLIRFQTFLESMKNVDLTKALEMYHTYWDTLLAVMEPEPGLKDLILDLGSRGIRIGIGSDMTAYIQFKKLEKLGVLDQLSFIVTSEEAGAEKPSPEFFRLCVEKAGCKAEECVFIGDSLKKDVEGAEKSGLYGIWYHPAPENRKHDMQETGSGYPVITSYEKCLKDGGFFSEI